MTIPTQGEDLVLREKIARVISPGAWEKLGGMWRYRDWNTVQSAALTKADDILSMISASPSREEGGDSPSQTSPSSEVFAPLPCRPEGPSPFVPRPDLAIGALTVAMKTTTDPEVKPWLQTALDFLTGDYEPLEDDGHSTGRD